MSRRSLSRPSSKQKDLASGHPVKNHEELLSNARKIEPVIATRFTGHGLSPSQCDDVNPNFFFFVYVILESLFNHRIDKVVEVFQYYYLVYISSKDEKYVTKSVPHVLRIISVKGNIIFKTMLFLNRNFGFFCYPRKIICSGKRVEIITETLLYSALNVTA